MSGRVIAIILAVIAAMLLIPRLMMPGAFMPSGPAPTPPPQKQSSAEKAREWIGVVSGGIAAIGSAFGGFSRAPSSNNETISI